MRGELAREQRRVARGRARDRGRALRPVIDGVEAGDVREQRLRGADVRGRLLAADVLLARLQRHAVGGVAVRVDRHADDAAGRLAHVLLERGEERGVRTAVAQRHAEALRVAEDDVGAHLSRRREQRQAEQIGADGDQHAGRLRARDEVAQIVDAARVRPAICTSAPKTRSPNSAVVEQSPTTQLDAERLGARAQDVERLRKAASRRRGTAACRRPSIRFACTRVQHRHRLGRGGGFVEQRRVGDLHPGQIAHHRLEIEERFEPALRDLGLIRRVRRVPARILEHVAQDHARRDAVVVAEADERPRTIWLLRATRAQLAQELDARAARPAGSAARLSRMRAGMASSMSASSDGAPTAFSIASRSSASGPMWRDWNDSKSKSMFGAQG